MRPTRLAEHPDFAAFLAAAATKSELPETFVEKDYWITEIQRTIATTLGELHLRGPYVFLWFSRKCP